MAKFQPVTISGMNAAASHPSGEGALKNIVLTLSGTADYGWSDHFNANWKQHFSMMKRRADASGATLTVRCLEEELEGGLLEELKQVVAATNKEYQVTLEGLEAARQHEADSAREERAKLDGLAKRLKFD